MADIFHPRLPPECRKHNRIHFSPVASWQLCVQTCESHPVVNPSPPPPPYAIRRFWFFFFFFFFCLFSFRFFFFFFWTQTIAERQVLWRRYLNVLFRARVVTDFRTLISFTVSKAHSFVHPRASISITLCSRTTGLLCDCFYRVRRPRALPEHLLQNGALSSVVHRAVLSHRAQILDERENITFVVNKIISNSSGEGNENNRPDRFRSHPRVCVTRLSRFFTCTRPKSS